MFAISKRFLARSGYAQEADRLGIGSRLCTRRGRRWQVSQKVSGQRRHLTHTRRENGLLLKEPEITR